MAGAGAKKRLEANLSRLNQLRLVATAAFASFMISIVIKAFVFRWSGITASFIWLAISGCLSAWSFTSIASYAAPSYDASGELLDGGGDLDNLKKGGLVSHFHDLLYISIFSQFGAVFSLRFLWAYALIPAYGLYLASVNFLLPWLRGRGKDQSEPELDPLTKKKLERTEKRAQKRATKWR